MRTFEGKIVWTRFPKPMADKRVITDLENRIRLLIDDHKRIAARCAELTAENGALKADNRQLLERQRQLESELSRMQLTAGLAGDDASRDKARARVNRLMREVDKCIALLSKSEPERNGAAGE